MPWSQGHAAGGGRQLRARRGSATARQAAQAAARRERGRQEARRRGCERGTRAARRGGAGADGGGGGRVRAQAEHAVGAAREGRPEGAYSWLQARREPLLAEPLLTLDMR